MMSMPEERPPMPHDPTTNQLPDWDLYRALREQWTHEDNLVNRGKWAAQALPFVFGALWLLAMAGAFSG